MRFPLYEILYKGNELGQHLSQSTENERDLNRKLRGSSDLVYQRVCVCVCVCVQEMSPPCSQVIFL